MMVDVIVVAYNPTWPQSFEEEKTRILDVVSAWIVDIQHVGSTSVPGLDAKPIVDILVGLPDLALVERCVEPLQHIGYEYLGENGIPDRHFFRKPGGDSWVKRDFNVHMTQIDGFEWKRMTLFRDHLRSHPEDARQYGMMKRELARTFAADRDGYVNGKSDFILAALAQTKQS